ncbi:hypothetical protein P3X46_022162 [Hevea brasiliensis]|uniref:Uncharacterized protein n=1 Tax=Hevea brasiliensis TaxID=3981 RepID=A0ABQ9LHT4_HEVBR|nr:hypothetical protein P3X46_022162 [Hevea brasiliensis]
MLDPSPSEECLKHHPKKMQELLHLSPQSLPITFTRLKIPRCSSIKGSSVVAYDASTVDYSAVTSIFPAEACETIGGEACDVEIYPEVKLKSVATSITSTTTEQIDKQVFLEEACDDLVGEFCDPVIGCLKDVS